MPLPRRQAREPVATIACRREVPSAQQIDLSTYGNVSTMSRLCDASGLMLAARPGAIEPAATLELVDQLRLPATGMTLEKQLAVPLGQRQARVLVVVAGA
jgi:hypothetical protein